MSDRFKDKIVLVSGAGQGIGRAIALAFAEESAMVAVLDIDQTSAAAVAAEVEDAGGRARALGVDVGDPEAVTRAVTAVAQSWGGVDVVVNNAGVERYGAAADLSIADWDTVLGTNLRGAWLLAKEAIPHMRARGGGAVVNIASVQAFVSEQRNAAYGVSKAGLVALARGIAVDYGADGIRATCVAPGSTMTPMLEAAAEKARPGDPEAGLREWAKTNLIGRIIQPEEVAKFVLFLASEDAGAITGSCHLIEGGTLARRGL